MTNELQDHGYPNAERRVRLAMRVVAAVAVTALIVVAYLAYHGISMSLRAENTYHNYRFALQVLTDYVDTNQRWPDSWNELMAHSPPAHVDHFRWPEDVDQIAEVVSIDFGLSIETVANMHEEQFTAVQQRLPNYGPRLDDIRLLLTAARKAASQSQ